MKADVISVRIPHAKPYYGVARLVVGGLAARADLSYEHLEDLQLALESVLENDAYGTGEEVTVELELRPDHVGMAVGPLAGERVRADLAAESEERIGLRRLLGTVVERADVEERAGGSWLRFEKQVEAVPDRGAA